MTKLTVAFRSFEVRLIMFILSNFFLISSMLKVNGYEVKMSIIFQK